MALSDQFGLPPLPQKPWIFDPNENTSAFPMPPADPKNPYPTRPGGYGTRPDGSQKGNGYFGAMMRPDGDGVSSEISIGVNLNGKEMEIPTMVPTLTPQEVSFLLTQNYRTQFKMPASIVKKASDYARKRLAEGRPVFAQAGEEQTSLHPQFRRAGVNPESAMGEAFRLLMGQK